MDHPMVSITFSAASRADMEAQIRDWIGGTPADTTAASAAPAASADKKPPGRPKGSTTTAAKPDDAKPAAAAAGDMSAQALKDKLAAIRDLFEDPKAGPGMQKCKALLGQFGVKKTSELDAKKPGELKAYHALADAAFAEMQEHDDAKKPEGEEGEEESAFD